MTAQQQAERDGIDLEAANKRLAAMGMQTVKTETGQGYMLAQEPVITNGSLISADPPPEHTPRVERMRFDPPKPPRKRRSDAGIPKPPKPAPAVPGALTEAQAERIRTLMIEKQEADLQASESMDAAREAGNRFNEYLRSLTRS